MEVSFDIVGAALSGAAFVWLLMNMTFMRRTEINTKLSDLEAKLNKGAVIHAEIKKDIEHLDKTVGELRSAIDESIPALTEVLREIVPHLSRRRQHGDG
ncbi:hypothetical protein [Magnetococcus sp. PR-3]|uniref:hypothetical protein n=1 Tax=Magnetococcus sp. PR-3 TaxID=3120355 RepID=UPI002FCE3F00